MSTQQPSDQLTTLAYRIASLEQIVKELQLQLHQYELARENDLKAQLLRAELDRVRSDLADVKREQAEINTRLIAQDLATQQQATAQQSSQDKLQIRVLVGILSGVLTVIIAVLVAFLTHHLV
jgi:DNA repair exonuclease SbcCD ATPase subunit